MLTGRQAQTHKEKTMALEKTVKDDKIEIVDQGDWKVLQVRTATIITDDGAELSLSLIHI